jgi:hypothetical protein
MKGPVLCHHPVVYLGDGNVPHSVLVVALILARLDQGAWRQELCLLRRLDIGEG